MEFHPGVKFSISTWAEKSWCHTWDSTRGKTNISNFISPQGENIFAKICSIFYKYVLWKKTFRMQVQNYIKTIMLDFINKRSKMFNFKTFKIVLLATTNSKIVTASLLTATKDLWSKKTTRCFFKRCHDFEQYCIWKGQATKKGSIFLALKKFT